MFPIKLQASWVSFTPCFACIIPGPPSSLPLCPASAPTCMPQPTLNSQPTHLQACSAGSPAQAAAPRCCLARSARQWRGRKGAWRPARPRCLPRQSPAAGRRWEQHLSCCQARPWAHACSDHGTQGQQLRPRRLAAACRAVRDTVCTAKARSQCAAHLPCPARLHAAPPGLWRSCHPCSTPAHWAAVKSHTARGVGCN